AGAGRRDAPASIGAGTRLRAGRHADGAGCVEPRGSARRRAASTAGSGGGWSRGAAIRASLALHRRRDGRLLAGATGWPVNAEFVATRIEQGGRAMVRTTG